MGSAPSAHQPNSIRSQFPTTYPPAHIRSAAQTEPRSLRPHVTIADFENVPFSETDEIATKFNHWRWVNDMRMTPISWLVPSLPMSQRPAVFRNTLAQVSNDLTRDEGQHEQSTQKQSTEHGKIFQAAEQVQEQPASATQSQNQWTNYIDLGDEDNDADFVLDK
ncbi:hypothetical protein LTR05_007446 [Lithohypha guttulata]|uniref:Uncharacterized protein n=1 Tax=Lithohypha guttulata TaxID=1690604 RepID=A0AAN7Y949_9EURO|nr:hypothetical protein LTR05_007446 [Lithohypha guttulata]